MAEQQSDSQTTEANRIAPDRADRILWPGPDQEMLHDPRFLAIWEVIRWWDIAVPRAYTGYCPATGNHARAILDILRERNL